MKQLRDQYGSDWLKHADKLRIAPSPQSSLDTEPSKSNQSMSKSTIITKNSGDNYNQNEEKAQMNRRGNPDLHGNRPRIHQGNGESHEEQRNKSDESVCDQDHDSEKLLRRAKKRLRKLVCRKF